MSTLPGIASKGEKGKQRYQSLDINSLYKPLEHQQQKNSLPRRHGGMQSLGKIPPARRIPANLPSLKSEHSGNDPAVSLVPSGGTGWGNKPGETGPQPPQTTTATTPTTQSSTPVVTVAQPSVPTTSSTPTVVTTVATASTPTIPTQSHGDKSWSAITSSGGETVPSFFAHQSPYFHQEFPSLSGSDAGGTPCPVTTKTDTQYVSGPSLRPQTEGSWMQGGSRPQGQMGAGAGSQQGTAPVQVPLPLPHLPPGIDVGGGRNNLGQSGVGVAQGGPVPQGHHMPPHPHFKGVVPPFMFRNFPGGFPPNFPNPMHGPLRTTRTILPYPPENRIMPSSRPAPAADPEELVPRPIIKEEDLKCMDDIARDAGWASHDDIDYNQKLAFSDDEGGQEEDTNRNKASRTPTQVREQEKHSEKESESSEREDRPCRENGREKASTQPSQTHSESRTAPEPTRGWQQPRSPAEYRPSPPPIMNFPPQQMRSHPHHVNDGGRVLEDDEIWQERVRAQNIQVAIATERAKQRKDEEEKRYEETRQQAIERAKQRKEEEEKRFEESRQAATKKLQKLEEKMGVSGGSGTGADDKDETSAPPTPPVVMPQAVNIAIPDWEKEKEKDRSRTSSEGKEDKSAKESAENFRQMTQLENRTSFVRERERDREMRGERDLTNQHPGSGQPAFSRQFQINLPPRFQKQQAERPPTSYYRQQSGGSPQPPSTSSIYEPRWANSSHFQQGSGGGSLKGRRNRTDSDVSDREREDDRSGKDSMRERRDRNTPDNNYDRERYRHDNRGRGDNRERSSGYDSKWKGSTGYYDGPDYNSSYRDYDNRQREREQETDERRETWEREKESRYYDEHTNAEKKPNDSYKPHGSVPLDPFDERDVHEATRHENERDSDRCSNMSERRSEYDKERSVVEQSQRSEPPQRPDSRDRPERPQRPDSRDSRASRESRNSRDSMRDDPKLIQESVGDREFSWADSQFESEPKEERPKRKEYREDNRRDMYPSYPQRHRDMKIPGPITREKLEAAERGNEPPKRNMLPLVRSDKKPDLKKTESQKDKQEQRSEDTQDAWQCLPSASETPPQPVLKSWADTTEEPVSTSPLLDKPLSNEQDNKSDPVQCEGMAESQQQKSEHVESHTAVKSERDEEEVNHRVDLHRDKIVGRGGRGVRHDSRGGTRQTWGSSMHSAYRGGGGAWRGESRGRRGGSRGQSRPQVNQDWAHSESEASGDEVSVSTESGKEERERRQDRGRKNAPRSPKQGSRKADKDNRSRESRRNDSDNKSSYSDSRHYEKRGSYDTQRIVGCGREGFAPRGEPSRRGRGGGGGVFRTRGNTPNVGQRVNSYGPPTSSKSPFTSQTSSTNEDKKVDEETEKSTEGTGERKGDDQQDQCTSSVDMSVEDKTKKNQQLLSAGIKGSGARQSTKSSVPPRMQRKPESDRRERGPGKSRDDNRRGQRGSLKGNYTGGSGSGGDQGEEAWETTSETSEQDDREREEHHEARQSNYSLSRHVSRGGSGRRNSQSARSGGEKRGGHDRSREVSRSTGLTGSSSQVNMNGRGPPVSSKMSSSSTPSPKDQIPMHRADELKYSDPNSVFQAVSDKKQQRTDKEKSNNLNRIADMSNFSISSMVVVDGRTEEEHSVFAADNGFKEVRSKKNVKEANRQQKEEVPQKGSRGGSTGSKDRGRSGSGNKPTGAQSPSPVCGLSPIMAPVSQNNPPQPTNKMPFEQRVRTNNKLPPRLAKQKQQHQQQQQQQLRQQQQQQEEVAEMNKLNQGVPLFPMKDLTSPAPPPSVNAWDKPITGALRSNSPPTSTNMQLNLGTQDCGIDVNEHPPSGASSQRSSPSGEKALSKMSREAVEKTVLDGTSPPVQTIIFENTSLKDKIPAPGDLAMKAKYNLKNQRMDKVRDRKLEDESGHVGLGGFKPPGSDMKSQDNKIDPIQMPVSFNKNEDSADMKLDFAFDSELSQLTDDKASKSMGLPHSMQMVQSSTADLNFKIASVKKVWENSIEHHTVEDGNVVSTTSSFTPAFGNAVEDPSSYVKSGVGVVDGSSVVQVDDSSSLNSGEHTYNAQQQMQSSGNSYSTGSVVSVPNMIKNDPNSSSSNVCKVKPQPQAVMSSAVLGGHPHSGPLSPPPSAFNSSNAQPSGQHMNFQPAAQYSSVGVSAIPSPPAAMLYGSQQIPGQELYHQTFQIGNTQVIGGQARSQFSQMPPYGLSQGLGQTSYNQQSVYLQTPPSGGPPPDLYQSQFRLPHSYGSSQPMSSNHSAVLISSNSNSLMTANVKPSSQQIGAIGSKGGYQPSAQPNPLFIPYDPNSVMNHNYSQLVQQVQQRPGNNIVPTMQPSSSFYSASAGGGTGYYQTTNSTLQAAQTPQTIPTQYGVQGYSTQSPAAAQVGPVGMGSFGSQFLSNTLQMAQQYRTSAPSYLKSSGAVTLVSDPSKSPSTNQQDVLNSVFSSDAQIPSPKYRSSGNSGGSGKPGSSSSGGPSQQQSSPTQGHHKIAAYHNISHVMQQQQQQQQAGGRGAMSIRGGNIQAQVPRYPSPIQRPVAYPQAMPGVNLANMMSGRHRVTTRGPPHLVNKIPSSAASAQYYNTQNNGVKLETSGLENKNEVSTSNNECNKLSDNGTSVAANKQATISDTPTEDNKPKAD